MLMKEASHKRLLTIWFHLHEILIKGNLILSDRKSDKWSFVDEDGTGLIQSDPGQSFLGDVKVLCVDWGSGDTVGLSKLIKPYT